MSYVDGSSAALIGGLSPGRRYAVSVAALAGGRGAGVTGSALLGPYSDPVVVAMPTSSSSVDVEDDVELNDGTSADIGEDSSAAASAIGGTSLS